MTKFFSPTRFLHNKGILALVLYVAGVLLAVWYVNLEARRSAKEAALREGRDIAASVLAFRKLYTRDVVARAATHGVRATHDFEDRPGTIPLPATLSMAYGEELGRTTGVRVRLHSPYPFPWREGRHSEAGDEETYQRLVRSPESEIVSQESGGEGTLLRYARADVMQPACVTCHNSHTDTPKRDWKTGDVRGVVEVIVPTDAVLSDSAVLRRRALPLGLLALLGLVGVSMIFRSQSRTTQKVHEAERVARSRADAIFTAAVEGIVVIDRQGTIEFVNPGTETLFGYPSGELIGENVRTLMPEPYRSEHDGYLQAFHQTGNAKVIGVGREVTGRRKDGSTFPLHLSVGKITVTGGYVGILRDITESKDNQRGLTEARDKAIRAARSKAEFLATMSHEIRTPLNAVIGMAGLLRRAELPAGPARQVKVLGAGADTLLSLVNDILDFSKLEEGKLELAPHSFRTFGVFENVAESLAFSANQKGIELILKLDPLLPRHLEGDAGRLQQILYNLIGNAIKFTSEGYVILSARPVPESSDYMGIEITVEDTGIGIPKEKQQSIFDSFSQAEALTTRKFGGTGLGLTITRRLVKMMGGEVEVASEPGHGATFTVVLPLPVSNKRTTLNADEDALFGMRVLAIDDIEPNRDVLIQWFQAWGIDGRVCASAHEALDEIRLAKQRGCPYEAVVVDFFMPEMDGVAFAREIRADTSCADLPLILSSSGTDELLPEDATTLFSGFVPKPLRIEQLRQALGESRGLSEAEVVETELPLERFPGMSVLVVDDVPTNLEVGRELLRQFGCEVRTASDGVEAVALCAGFDFDLVLMDCNMPRMNGFEATRRIRAREAGRARVPIIASTAGVLEEDRARSVDAGMDGFLEKPIILASLRKVLERYSPEDTSARQPSAPPEKKKEAELRKTFEAAFRATASRKMIELQASVDESNTEGTVRAAHALRGSIGTLSTAPVKKATLEIEASAAANDWTEVRRLAASLAKLLEAP